MPVAEQKSVDTEQPEIMQRLHYGAPFCPVICGRRDERKRVMYVDYSGMGVRNDLSQLTSGSRVPDSATRKAGQVHFRRLAVVVRIARYSMAVRLEQFRFSIGSLIFSAPISVIVMNKQ